MALLIAKQTRCLLWQCLYRAGLLVLLIYSLSLALSDWSQQRRLYRLRTVSYVLLDQTMNDVTEPMTREKPEPETRFSARHVQLPPEERDHVRLATGFIKEKQKKRLSP